MRVADDGQRSRPVIQSKEPEIVRHPGNNARCLNPGKVHGCVEDRRQNRKGNACNERHTEAPPIQGGRNQRKREQGNPTQASPEQAPLKTRTVRGVRHVEEKDPRKFRPLRKNENQPRNREEHTRASEYVDQREARPRLQLMRLTHCLTCLSESVGPSRRPHLVRARNVLPANAQHDFACIRPRKAEEQPVVLPRGRTRFDTL